MEMERYCIFDVTLLTVVYTGTDEIDLYTKHGLNNNTANSERFAICCTSRPSSG